MACVTFVNLCHIAGTNIYVDWSYTDDEGEPIDLTGVNAQMQYLTDPNDVSSVIDLTGSGTNGIVDGVGGLGQHTLTPVQAQSLLPIGSGSSINFISNLMFTYPDTTIEVVAGVNTTIEQNLIR